MKVNMRKLNFKLVRFIFILLVMAVSSVLLYFFFSNKQINTIPLSLTIKDKCASLPNQYQKTQCWQDLLKAELNKNGLAQAFNLLQELYAQNQDFVPQCHAFTHTLGQEAYKLFRNKTKFTVSPSFSACSFGIYHGFMEALIYTTGDYKEAQDFCQYINQNLTQQNSVSERGCYHGIGHGIVNDHSPSSYGNVIKIAKQALAICEKVAVEEGQLNNCASGVFNGIVAMYQKRENGLIPDKKNPFWFCPEIPQRYKNYCYGFMARVFFDQKDKDLIEAVNRIENTSLIESDYSKLVVLNLALTKATNEIGKEGKQPNILFCQKLNKIWLPSCIKGYVRAVIQNGPPGLEYENAIEMCNSLVNRKEKDTCFTHLIDNISSLYPSEKLERVCGTMKNHYQDICLDSIKKSSTKSLKALKVN